jgi:hypothetical protein
VQDTAVNKEGRQESPDPAVYEVVKAKDKILFGKRRRLLPGPEASRYAGEYEEKVDSQGIIT